MYELGRGVKQDYQQAVHWYRKAAEQGDAQAQCNLGLTYMFDFEYAQAFYWIKKAADQGNAQALNSLGHMYQNGDGVEVDQKLALECFQKAAEKGFIRAQIELGRNFFEGTYVE